MDDLVRESFDFSGGTVDESGPYPIIKNVLICGLKSVHGYEYLPSAWSDADLKRYEGIASYEGHKDGERLPSEKVGWFTNIRRRADGRPEGDYVLEPDHQMTPRLIRAAKHRPDGFALSHHANVKWGVRNGQKVVEGFRAIRSVDVVDKGGTTGGLFESSRGRTVTKVSDYANKIGVKCNVEQLLRLKDVVKESGDAPMMADAPDAGAAETKADDGVTAAFLSAMMSKLKECMDGNGDKEARKACAKIVGKMLLSHADFKDDAEEKPKEEPKPAEKPKEDEAAKESARVAAINTAITDEIVRESFAPSANQLKALRGMTESADRVAFIREQKGLAAHTNPKSKGREGTPETDKVKEGAGDGKATGVEEARKVMADLSKDCRGAK